MMSQKAWMYIFLPLVIGCILLNLGCTSTYEITVYEGHPATLDVYEPAYKPSKTLAKTDPIDTEPARSDQWSDEDKEHEHDQNHHHGSSFNPGGLTNKEGIIKLKAFSPFCKFERSYFPIECF